MKKLIYYCPADGWFGDPMPMYHDGVYHIYYTKLHERGGLCWGHIATRDFVNCIEYPDPFPYRAPGTPVNTGCVYYAEGMFHAYYAGTDENGVMGMYHSDSADGITFRAPGEMCLKRPETWYRQDGTWRDPSVFYDDEAGVYRMIFCAKAPEEEKQPNCFAGVIGQATSRDLLTWECLPPMELSGIATTMECPEIWKWENRYVLSYYWHETRFRTADSPTGPWERGSVISPDHFDFMAARHMQDGKRHFLIGWLPRKTCDCSHRIWGGCMPVPREISVAEGRTMESRFVREIYDAFPEQDLSMLPENCSACGDGCEIMPTGFRMNGGAGGGMISFERMPDECLMRMDVEMKSEFGTVVLLFGTHAASGRAGEYLDEGYQLILDAAEGLIRLRRHYEWDHQTDIAILPWKFTPGKPIRLEIVRHTGILEVGVDEKQTMVSRLLEDQPGGWAISAQDGEAEISGFTVWKKAF